MANIFVLGKLVVCTLVHIWVNSHCQCRVTLIIVPVFVGVFFGGVVCFLTSLKYLADYIVFMQNRANYPRLVGSQALY